MDIGRAPQSIDTVSGIVHNPRAPQSRMHVCSLESPAVSSRTPKAKQLPSVQAENSERGFRIRSLQAPSACAYAQHPSHRHTPATPASQIHPALPSPALPHLSAAGPETAFPTATPQVIPGNFCSLEFEVLWQLGLQLLLNFFLAVL